MGVNAHSYGPVLHSYICMAYRSPVILQGSHSPQGLQLGYIFLVTHRIRRRPIGMSHNVVWW
jgi:hypothetical protein